MNSACRSVFSHCVRKASAAQLSNCALNPHNIGNSLLSCNSIILQPTITSRRKRSIPKIDAEEQCLVSHIPMPDSTPCIDTATRINAIGVVVCREVDNVGDFVATGFKEATWKIGKAEGCEDLIVDCSILSAGECWAVEGESVEVGRHSY